MKKTTDAFEQMMEITLPRAGSNEQQFRFVAVNGRTFQVPCGRTVSVPAPVYEALENARCQQEEAQKAEQAMAAC